MRAAPSNCWKFSFTTVFLTGKLTIRRVRVALSGASERRTFRVLAVGPAGLHRLAVAGGRPSVADPPWTEPLRWQEQVVVNKKAVYGVLKQKRWLVHQRACMPGRLVQHPLPHSAVGYRTSVESERKYPPTHSTQFVDA